MKNFFAILGGMGTPATTNFLLEMNKYYHPTSDQKYLDYVLFNHASVPDRTNFILGKSDENPLVFMLEDLKQIEKLDADFVVITCNTAHYFYDELQDAVSIPIINMPQLVKNELKKYEENTRIGLFATEGTVKSGLYSKIVEEAGCTLVNPDDALQQRINKIIYDDVKGKSWANLGEYYSILDEFSKMNVESTILGCTEISFLNNHDTDKKFSIIDAELLLLKETVKMGLQTQNKSDK